MALDNLTPDRDQQIVINMSAERTAVVKGVAGSGKSLTLLKKAKQVSTISKSYAIIVYTKSLKQFFIEELAEIGQSEGHVYYYKEWTRSNKPHVTYMFVDECQDFNSEEIADFKTHGTYCWFFGDSDQSIMDFPDHSVQSVEDTARQLGVRPIDLTINHRLTIENAKIGEYVNPDSRLSFACIKHGAKPRAIKDNAQIDKIISYIQNGQLSNVGILVYYNQQVKRIRDYFGSKGIPVQWKTQDNMVIDFKSTSPKIITWHCAKGLQFNDVFIPCCGIGDYKIYANGSYDPVVDDAKKSALYVSTTRPLENLYLLFSNPLSHRLPPEDSDLYSGNEIDDDDLPF